MEERGEEASVAAADHSCRCPWRSPTSVRIETTLTPQLSAPDGKASSATPRHRHHTAHRLLAPDFHIVKPAPARHGSLPRRVARALEQQDAPARRAGGPRRRLVKLKFFFSSLLGVSGGQLLRGAVGQQKIAR